MKLQNYLTNKIWQIALKETTDQEYFQKLNVALTQMYQNDLVYPPKNLIFNAFNLCPLNKIKVVIIGSEPYANDSSDGLAFSSNDSQLIPASLKTIYTELSNDLHILNTTGDLTKWAKRGVLLLNTMLTVGQHSKHTIWQKFTNEVIQLISNQRQHICYILCGNEAHKKIKFIDSRYNLIIRLAHPSPNMTLKSKYPWIGSKCFSKCNNYLKRYKQQPINWKL